MSYLPYGPSPRTGWFAASGASLLVHAGVLALLFGGATQIFRPAPPREAARPDYTVTLERLDSDTLAGLIETAVLAEPVDTPEDGTEISLESERPTGTPDPAVPEEDPSQEALSEEAPSETELAEAEPAEAEAEPAPTEEPAETPTETLTETPADAEATQPDEPEPLELAALPIPEVPDPELPPEEVAPLDPETIPPETVQPEAAMPEPVMPDPVSPDPVLPEPVTPEPLIAAPVAPLPSETGPLMPQSPLVPQTVVPLGTGFGTAAGGAPSPSPAPGLGAALQPVSPFGAAPGAQGSATTGTETGAASETGRAAQGVTPIAPAAGARPQPARPPARPVTAQDLAIAELIRKIRASVADPCLVALPRRDGADAIGIELIASTDAAMAQFADAVLTGPDADWRQTRTLVDPRQCPALTFLRQSGDYPATRLAIALDQPEIASGGRLSGVLRGAAGRYLTLLLIDNNGVVQDLQRFTTFSGNFARFEVPVSRAGPQRDTSQMLLAIATTRPATVLKSRIDQLAADVFAGDVGVDLGGFGQTSGSSGGAGTSMGGAAGAALAITTFDVR